MSTIKSYAAKEAGADLSLWEYDAGETAAAGCRSTG